MKKDEEKVEVIFDDPSEINGPYLSFYDNEKKRVRYVPTTEEMSCIIKKDSPDVAKIQAAIKAAYDEGLAKLKGNSKSVPPLEALKTPLRDGDIERPDDPDYAGCYFVNANSVQPVGIVDRDCNPILDHSEIYSGVRGRVSITFYAFNTSTARGIAASLNNVQKWSDGPALGGKASPEEDFAEIEDGEDEFLS